MPCPVMDRRTEGIPASSFHSGIASMCVLSMLSRILFEVLGVTIRQGKEKYTKIAKEETKFSLFVDDIVV